MTSIDRNGYCLHIEYTDEWAALFAAVKKVVDFAREHYGPCHHEHCPQRLSDDNLDACACGIADLVTAFARVSDNG